MTSNWKPMNLPPRELKPTLFRASWDYLGERERKAYGWRATGCDRCKQTIKQGEWFWQLPSGRRICIWCQPAE